MPCSLLYDALACKLFLLLRSTRCIEHAKRPCAAVIDHQTVLPSSKLRYKNFERRQGFPCRVYGAVIEGLVGARRLSLGYSGRMVRAREIASPDRA